jgi:two-component system, NtrC family, sensor kinase
VPSIRCHPHRLNQVWMNLLVNAVQATPDGGTVTVRTAATETGVRVEVEDTGTGVSRENLERIFEPGFTTKSGRISMGLGLAITREVVQQHGGRIAVTSEPGVGTRFTVELPAAGPPVQDADSMTGGA